MKDLIEAIRNKSKSCNIHTQRGRDIKGAYVDCIIMIQEWQKINSVYLVLAEVRAELLHDAMGLLMNHEQHEDDGWKTDYEELVKKYSEHFR